MSEYTLLQGALHRAIGTKASPEVMYQITVAIHDRLVDAIEEHPSDAITLVPLATTVLQSASSLIHMFGGHGADKAWAQHRFEQKPLRRMMMPTQTPAWFRRKWSEDQHEIGTQIVHRAFLEARS